MSKSDKQPDSDNPGLSGKNSPLDFYLLDAEGQPALSILYPGGQKLTLGIINTSAEDLMLGKLGGEKKCHFKLRFRKRVLLSTSKIMVECPDSDWEEVKHLTNTDDLADEIWIKGPANLLLSAGQEVTISMHNVQADPSFGVRSSRVKYMYEVLQAGDQNRELIGYCKKMIHIIN
jgi:hypothetical protein